MILCFCLTYVHPVRIEKYLWEAWEKGSNLQQNIWLLLKNKNEGWGSLWWYCVFDWPMSHRGPSQPSKHWHTKLPSVFWQEAPFLHRNMGHSLTSSLQVGPDQPGGQRQMKDPSVLIQEPLFMQGFNRHSLTSAKMKSIPCNK